MSIKVRFTESGLLQWMNSKGDYIDVNIVDSFPLSSPGKFLSLVNDKGDEVAFIDSEIELDSTGHQAIREALESKNFHFEVEQILTVDEQQELRCYDVVTKQGKRKVFTQLDEWPSKNGDGSIKIEDLFGDIYIIRDSRQLPEESQKLLSYYVE